MKGWELDWCQAGVDVGLEEGGIGVRSPRIGWGPSSLAVEDLGGIRQLCRWDEEAVRAWRGSDQCG